jgi:hypothetical protein
MRYNPMRLQKRTIIYEDVSIDANELMTIREASQMLGIGLAGVRSAIARDAFTEIIDVDAIERNRRYNARYLLRSEVEAAAAQ